ncbi:methyl-accepting chemotaxis protein [Solidesulfovibrio sp.]|uniref:methyl-accepting chemotaxis protein n=1 Tax=Solidesulfovibrio sp. TaxID=2910990 RepID=UPI0026352DF8|nr:methyl-accepting chemotaxis protein [Solidesulfovibrio sp.]
MADTTHRAREANAALRECRRALGGMGQGLTSVVHGREKDFLALGESLMELESSCGDISRQADELTSCATGQNLHVALERFSGQLAGLTGGATVEAGRASLRDIEAVAGIVEELAGILSAFSRIVKHLSMLGIATRIESARLGGDGRGFSTLADDVEKLAHLIVDHCAGIAAKVEALRGHVASARERTLGIIHAQEQCFELVSRELSANIAGLAAMSASSAELSVELARNAESIRAEIGQAVRSLQSHDIVRQQIEHAEHALAEVAHVLDEDGGRAGEEDAVDLAAFVADVLTLQDSQLKSADEHFAQAADRLRGALDSLAARIRNIGEAITSAIGGQGKDNSLARVESGIAMVKEELGGFAAQGEALGGIMDSVAGTITDMGGSIEAIEEVGAEIELIAINASIKAAHTGAAGAALGVLALAIQRLSVDAIRQTDAVAGILREISKASRTLQDNAGRCNDQTESWRVIGELDAVLSDASASSGRCLDLFESLQRSSASVGERAAKVGAGIDFDRDIGARLGAIRRALADQVSLARKVAPEGGSGRSARLRQLYDRYTMEAERAVHEAAFGQAGSGAAAPAAGPASEDSGEFGDNVELF